MRELTPWLDAAAACSGNWSSSIKRLTPISGFVHLNFSFLSPNEWLQQSILLQDQSYRMLMAADL